MGNIVFVRPDGTRLEADPNSDEAKTLQAAGYQTEGADEFHARAREAGREAYYTSGTEKVKTAIEGLGSGVTLGLSDVMVRHLPGAEDSEARRHYNPMLRTGTELAGTVLAALPTGGESLAARAATMTPTGILAKGAAKVGGAFESKLLGRAAEGATWGVGGAFQHSNVTGDPLTVEGVVEGAGMGAILNVAMGAIGDRVAAFGKGAKERVAAKVAQEADEALIAKRAAHLEEPPPSWDELRTIHKTEQAALRKQNVQLEDAAVEHTKFLNEELNNRLRTDVSRAINEVRSYYAPVKQAAEEVAEVATQADLPLHLRNKAAQTAKAGPAKVTGVAEDGTVTLSAGRKISWGQEGRRAFEAAEQVKQPMSEDVANFLREIDEQKSRALKLWGGGRDVSKGRWTAHDPNIAPNRDAALAELREIKMKMEARFPSASSHIRELPVKPPPPTPFDPVDLPKKLMDLGRMNDDQMARFIGSVERNKPVQGAMERLIKDLDVQPGASIGEGVVNLRGVLSEHSNSVARLEEMAVKGDKDGGGILDMIRGTTKKAARYAAGREADKAVGYGWKGAVAKSAVGGALGYAMGGVEGSLLGAALLSGRQGAKGKIRDAVGKRAETTGLAMTKLAPVTSYLATRFPSGEDDHEKDVRQRAVNRMEDVYLAAHTGPDAMFYAVEGMLGDESDIGWKLHNHINSSLRYLADHAPKDPGLDISLQGSRWTPSHQQVVEFAHRFEAVTSPMQAITRALSGDGHPVAAQALWDRYPAMMTELATEFVARAGDMKIKYEAGGAFRDLFRAPITGLQQPEVAATLQGLYLPKPSQPAGPGGKQPSTPGRPAAIQSPVIGSSPSGHYRS